MDDESIPPWERILDRDSAKLRRARRKIVGDKLVDEHKTFGLTHLERKQPPIPCPVPDCRIPCKDKERLKAHLKKIHQIDGNQAERMCGGSG